MESIELKGLTRRFGPITAVDRVDLLVHPGEIFGLLGPNGAGKSTMIKMITGLLRPSEGTVKVLGFDVTRHPIEVKRRVGVLPEELHLYERLTGEEYLHFTGRMYGLEESVVRTRTAQLLHTLEMADDGGRLIIDYSQGMRKKVALAAAIIHKPAVVFLDEPFNGVDVVSSRSIRNILNHLVGKGMTVFFSSHVMELVEKLCTRVAILKKGRLIACGTLDEIRASLSIDKDKDLEEVFLQTIGETAFEQDLSWLG
ncbi:MAG: ABC transporter ATP-binding protein [Candidatus Wallbacteria bacterium]|nr:ABC transporter ATP-binding protein [Candidatus Wallbacteria bacterium]